MRYITLTDTTYGSSFIKEGSIVDGNDLDKLYPKVFQRLNDASDDREALIQEVTKRAVAEVMKRIKAELNKG